MWTLLRCVGKAVVVKGGKALLNAASGGVLGEALEVAEYAWEEYSRQTRERPSLAELQGLAQMPGGEGRKLAAEVAQEVAADQPDAVRQNLAVYLELIPATLRRSLRRPSDPAG